jgi:hypothetical protein
LSFSDLLSPPPPPLTPPFDDGNPPRETTARYSPNRSSFAPFSVRVGNVFASAIGRRERRIGSIVRGLASFSFERNL